MDKNEFFKDIHVYVLYIYEEEIKKFKNQMEKNNVKLDYSFYLGANGNAFKPYFPKFIKKRKEEVADNPIYKKLRDIIGGKKFYLKNEKQLGHTRSFINMIRNAKKNKYKKMCILESDVIFIKDFEEKIKEYQEIIEKTSLFYLGSNDNKISRTTNLFPFNEEISYSKICHKYPNLTEEEKLEMVEKKRENFHKKRLKYKDRIEKNNELLNSKKIYLPYCPYGTFAMIIDESIYDLVLEVLELHVYPTDVLFFYIQDILEEEKWAAAYPNLIIADVSHSYILQERHFEKFSEGRGWNLVDYFT